MTERFTEPAGPTRLPTELIPPVHWSSPCVPVVRLSQTRDSPPLAPLAAARALPRTQAALEGIDARC